MLDLLWSTEMPTLLANAADRPACFNSVSENPFPKRTLPAYFLVVDETIGLSLLRGLGKVDAAF
jgi:hypothetical protein